MFTSRSSSSVRVLALLALAAASSAHANTYWSENPATPDDWFDANAWSAGIPSTSQTAYIANGGTATISYGTAYTEGVYVGTNNNNNNGSSGTLLLTAGQLSCGNYSFDVGYANGISGAEGLVNQSGGQIVAGPLSLGISLSSSYSASGTYELSGAAELSASAETIGSGQYGSGQFLQTGGINNCSGLLYVYNGSYSISGDSSLTAAGLYGGNCTFIQNGGSANFGMDGFNLDKGIASITNGAILNVTGSGVGIGDGASAIFIQTDSICNFGGVSLYIGSQAASSVTSAYTMSGNSQLYAGNEYVGGIPSGGVATFTQAGGTNNLGNYNLYVGGYNSTSSYSLQTGATLLAANELIGGVASASFTQSGGTNILGGNNGGVLTIGTNPQINGGGAGSYFLNGGSLTSSALNIGYSAVNANAAALFDQTGGSNITNAFSIAAFGRYDLLAGIFQVTKSFSNSGTFDLQNPAAAGLSGSNILNLGTMSITNTLTGGNGTLDIEQNAALYAGSITQGSLIIGGKIQIAPQSQTSKINSLNITTGALDITDNELVIDYPTNGPTPLPSVRSYLHSGYASNWTGAGIISSTAAGNLAVGIGYAEASDLGVATFGGVAVDSTAILLRYTWIGDANLDGKVDASDLAMMQSNGTTWDTGDFNYDGVVNADDYALFDLGAAVSGGNLIPLPEPGEMSLFVIPLILIGIRRRTSIGTVMD